MLEIEKKYWSNDCNYIAGIDEAGRGPLAGPVVAACVILEKNKIIEGVDDSKKISSKKRELLYDIICENAVDIGIGVIEEDEIDKINILQATYLAMKTSIGKLKQRPDLILIDGPNSNIKHYEVKHVINGDKLSQSIAAASIIAKVTRDRIMVEYDKIFPIYKFYKHKGYGTKYHMEIIKKNKTTPIHRQSFKIVKNNMPRFKMFYDKKLIGELGHQLIGVYFIKKNHTILDKNILLVKNDDIVDYLFLHKNNLLFIKVLTICNNKAYCFGKNIKTSYKKYINELSSYLKEKDVSKIFTFDVISITLIKGNKPKLETIFSEKIS